VHGKSKTGRFECIGECLRETSKIRPSNPLLERASTAYACCQR
jgi:hypothetical protein